MNTVTLDLNTLARLLQDAAYVGATQALGTTGALKPYLSQTEAWNQFGRGNVTRWIKEGLITPIKDGQHSAKIRLDRAKLEAISRTANTGCYLNTIERK